MRARYVGVRGENASKNRAMAPIGLVVACYSNHSIYLGVHHAEENNRHERIIAINATTRGGRSLIDALSRRDRPLSEPQDWRGSCLSNRHGSRIAGHQRSLGATMNSFKSKAPSIPCGRRDRPP